MPESSKATTIEPVLKTLAAPTAEPKQPRAMLSSKENHCSKTVHCN